MSYRPVGTGALLAHLRPALALCAPAALMEGRLGGFALACAVACRPCLCSRCILPRYDDLFKEIRGHTAPDRQGLCCRWGGGVESVREGSLFSPALCPLAANRMLAQQRVKQSEAWAASVVQPAARHLNTWSSKSDFRCSSRDSSSSAGLRLACVNLVKGCISAHTEGMQVCRHQPIPVAIQHIHLRCPFLSQTP